MPAEAIPVVATVIVLFALFIGFVGGAALWTALPRRRPPGKR